MKKSALLPPEFRPAVQGISIDVLNPLRNESPPRRSFVRQLFALIVSSSSTLALLCAGCSSAGKSEPGSFASVAIHSQSADQVRATTVQVFRKEGYAAGQSATGQLVFERPASALTTVSRDGLIAAHGGVRTIERVKVQLSALGGGSFRLGCEAYMVSGAGDAFFEEEQRLNGIRSGPYQSLLNQVAERLKQP